MTGVIGVQEEVIMSLRPLYMCARTQRQPSRSSQGIFERAVQDPFGWSGEDALPVGGGMDRFNKSESFNGFDSRWGESLKTSNGLPKSPPSTPPRSNSIPSHLYGLERYVSSGLDELSATECEPMGRERKKSFIEMSLARSFSREE